MNSIFKPKKIRSRKIRKSADGEACKLRIPGICNADRSTTVFAHINSNFKGIGNKSPDLFGCYACSACHAALDAGKINAGDQLRAMQETLFKLYQKGLIQVKL